MSMIPDQRYTIKVFNVIAHRGTAIINDTGKTIIVLLDNKDGKEEKLEIAGDSILHFEALKGFRIEEVVVAGVGVVLDKIQIPVDANQYYMVTVRE